MADCVVCGKSLSFWKGDEHRRCDACVAANKWPAASAQSQRPGESAYEREYKNRENSKPQRNVAFLLVAWVLAWASLIGGVILAVILLSYASGVYGRDADFYFLNGILAFVSGLVGFVFCGGIAVIIEHLRAIRASIEEKTPAEPN